ncbi:hypothetical protein [Enhydrobacter aerosaccus]|nr:hypothetical protein [Enhydrobacter aerosaccus]
MRKIETMAVLATALLFGGCTETTSIPAPVTTAAQATGPMDPDSVTKFTLALQPDSISGCILTDPSMTRPMTLTVRSNRAELVTSGGVHGTMMRVAPNVYAGGFVLGQRNLSFRADLSTSPKRLTVTTPEGGCRWAASA